MKKKFEYLVVYIVDTDLTDDPEMDMHLDADHYTDRLNRYGNAGWELVDFTWDTPDGAKATFKREKSD